MSPRRRQSPPWTHASSGRTFDDAVLSGNRAVWRADHRRVGIKCEQPGDRRRGSGARGRRRRRADGAGIANRQPPYSRITAIDLDRGDIKWRVPFGATPDTIGIILH